MVVVKQHYEGQLELNLFEESQVSEQITFTEWQILRDLEDIWGRIKSIYKKGAPLTNFFESVDIFTNNNNERNKLKQVRELCRQNESLVKQYINLYLNN